jgi:drug/metabolite transporter (DMT)-like permease
MRIFNRKYLAAVVIVLAVGLTLSMVGDSTSYERRASIISALAASLTGILIGTLVTCLSAIIERFRDATQVSGILAGILGAIAGAVVAFAINFSAWEQIVSVPLVIDVVVCLAGIVIGTKVFNATRRAVSVLDPRLLSVLISGSLGIIAGIFVGSAFVCPLWDEIVFTPHPKAYSGDLVYAGLILYAIIWTCIASAVPGARLGLPADSSEQAS